MRGLLACALLLLTACLDGSSGSTMATGDVPAPPASPAGQAGSGAIDEPEGSPGMTPVGAPEPEVGVEPSPPGGSAGTEPSPPAQGVPSSGTTPQSGVSAEDYEQAALIVMVADPDQYGGGQLRSIVQGRGGARYVEDGLYMHIVDAQGQATSVWLTGPRHFDEPPTFRRPDSFVVRSAESDPRDPSRPAWAHSFHFEYHDDHVAIATGATEVAVSVDGTQLLDIPPGAPLPSRSPSYLDDSARWFDSGHDLDAWIDQADARTELMSKVLDCGGLGSFLPAQTCEHVRPLKEALDDVRGTIRDFQAQVPDVRSNVAIIPADVWCDTSNLPACAVNFFVNIAPLTACAINGPYDQLTLYPPCSEYPGTGGSSDYMRCFEDGDAAARNVSLGGGRSYRGSYEANFAYATRREIRDGEPVYLVSNGVCEVTFYGPEGNSSGSGCSGNDSPYGSSQANFTCQAACVYQGAGDANGAAQTCTLLTGYQVDPALCPAC